MCALYVCVRTCACVCACVYVVGCVEVEVLLLGQSSDLGCLWTGFKVKDVCVCLLFFIGLYNLKAEGCRILGPAACLIT